LLRSGRETRRDVGQDAPGDENHRLFQTNVGSLGCVLLFSNASFNRHTAASAQRNLSLDITPSSIALGLNYMVAEVSTDGNNSTTDDMLFLDPADCDHNVNGTWASGGLHRVRRRRELHDRRQLPGDRYLLV
jgi:hypothetical protein